MVGTAGKPGRRRVAVGGSGCTRSVRDERTRRTGRSDAVSADPGLCRRCRRRPSARRGRGREDPGPRGQCSGRGDRDRGGGRGSAPPYVRRCGRRLFPDPRRGLPARVCAQRRRARAGRADARALPRWHSRARRADLIGAGGARRLGAGAVALRNHAVGRRAAAGDRAGRVRLSDVRVARRVDPQVPGQVRGERGLRGAPAARRPGAGPRDAVSPARPRRDPAPSCAARRAGFL